MSSRPGPSPLETAALQLLEQRDENDSIVSAILPALQVLVSGDSSTAVQSQALDQLGSWLAEYRSFKASQQLDSTITMTGWLRKVGTSRLTNQRRWVVLEHSTLYYYADRAETQLKGVLHLPGCRCYFSKSVTDLHAHVFTVTTKPLAKSSALAGSGGRSGGGSMLPDELEGVARSATAPSMGPQCVPLPPADLAVDSSNLVASSGNAAAGSLEAEVLNPLHTSKIKYRWAASSEEERNSWVAAIRAAAGRPAIEQVALAWARVLKGALNGPAYKRMLFRMATMGARLPPHALSQPITVTACASAAQPGVCSIDEAPLTPPSRPSQTAASGDTDSFVISPDAPSQSGQASVAQASAPSAQAVATTAATAVAASSPGHTTATSTTTSTPSAAAGGGIATQEQEARSTPSASPVAAGPAPQVSHGGAHSDPAAQTLPPDAPVARRRSTGSKRTLLAVADHVTSDLAAAASAAAGAQGGAVQLRPPPAAASPAFSLPPLGARQLPPLFASPPALHLSADWIRVVMRSSERLRDMDMEGGAQHMPPPPSTQSAPQSESEDKANGGSSGGGFLSMFRRSKNKAKDTAGPAAGATTETGPPVPALPASKLISASNPAALAAGVVPPSLMSPVGVSAGDASGGDMSTPQRPTRVASGGGLFSSGSTPSRRLRGPDSAAAAASSAAAMQSGPVRFRLSGGGQGGGGSGSSLPRGGPGPSPLRTPSGAGTATEDAVTAVAVAEAQRARRFAGHIAGDRVDTAQLQRDFGRDTVITAVQVHPVYTALTAAHGVPLEPPEGGLRRHVNAAPHEVLSHVTASILEVVGGVNAALAAQYANPVRVPWQPSGGYGGVVGSDFSGPAALDASFEAAIGAYASDEASSAGGASPGKRGLFQFPPSPARPSAARNTSNGAGSEGSGRPPLHPLADSGSAGGAGTPIEVSGSDGTPIVQSPGGVVIAEHGSDRVPVFAMPAAEPRFHLGAWPYPPSSLSSSSDRGTWGGSGLQARVLTFAREILLCSARTITGGDTFDAAAFLFQHPDLALLMPDSASAPPIRLLVQVLPGVHAGGVSADGPPPAAGGPTHSRDASDDTTGSALSHFTDSLSSSGAGAGFGSSFSEAEGGSTDAVPPPVLRVQLQSAMHYRLRSSELEDEELMGWDGGDLGPPLTPLGYAPATSANADDARADAEVLRRRWAEGDWARVTAVFTRDFVWGRMPQPAQIALAVQTHPGLGGGEGGGRLASHHRRT